MKRSRASPAREGQGPCASGWKICAAPLLLAAQVALGAAPASLTGTAVEVADGDTVTLLDSARQRHVVRLAGVDAPERGQPGGYRSKDSLAALVRDQPVRVDWQARDSAGRIVGALWVAPPGSPCRGDPQCPMTLDAGLAQIAAGRAWRSTNEPGAAPPERAAGYELAEREARARKAGLWRNADAVAPWVWRARRGGS